MSERRALLDPDMYKISEEDSQDEEVLSSLGSLNLTNFSNNGNECINKNLQVQVQPRSQSKVLKPRTLNLNSSNSAQTQSPGQGQNNNNSHANPVKKPKRRTGATLPSLPQSLSNGNKRKHLLEKSLVTEGSEASVPSTTTRVLFDRVDWPASTSSSDTDTSDTQSARSINSETETNGSHHSDSDTSSSSASSRNNSQSYDRGGQIRTRPLNGDEASVSSSCSSCDTPPRGRNRRCTYSRSSASTSASGSDLEEKHLGDTASYHISEMDILSSTNEEGNMALVEAYSSLQKMMGLPPMSPHPAPIPKVTTTSSTSMTGIPTTPAIDPSTSANSSVLSALYTSLPKPINLGDPPMSKINTKSAACQVPSADETGTGTPTDSLKPKKEKFRRNLTDVFETLEKPQEAPPPPRPLPQTKESKTGKGRISRFLTRNRTERSTLSTISEVGETSKSPPKTKVSGSKGIKGKSRKMKIFRFKDEDEGEVRDVEMNLTSWDHRSNLGRRATLSESLLGIVPGRFSSPVTIPNSNGSKTSKASKKGGVQWEMEDDRIMVAGFIPDGPAIKNRHVKIGDWLRTVNGNSVNFANIDSVLSRLKESEDWYPQSIQGSTTDLQKRVNLGLQRMAGSLINEEAGQITVDAQDNCVVAEEVIPKVKGVSSRSGLRNAIPIDVLSTLGLIYISASTPPSPSSQHQSSSTSPHDGTKEVTFSWPLKIWNSKWKVVGTLVASQGMFATLYQLLRDVTGSHPILSKVEVESDIMEVTYWSDNGGESLLLLAITVKSQGRRLRNTSTVSVMNQLSSAIAFRWGTLKRAFSEGSEEEMDRFLSNTLAPLIDTKEFLFMKEPILCPISTSVEVIVDERLYAFEASDFYSHWNVRRSHRGKRADVSGMDEDVLHCLGSCLFYKERICISHLERVAQVKLYGWMMSELNWWNGNWQPMKRIILWQRSYLADQDGEEPSLCYTVVVGIDDVMLAFILKPVGEPTKKRGPDVKWIQKALKSVAWFVRRDITSRINHDSNGKSVELLPWNFKNGPSPSKDPGTLTNVKKKSNVSGSKERERKLPKGGVCGSILKNTDLQYPTSGFPTPKLKKSAGQAIREKGGLALLSEEYVNSYRTSKEPIGNESFDDLDESTTGTESDPGSFKWSQSEDRSLSGENSYSYAEVPARPISIMKGNVLFHFIQMEFGRGVMLTSIGLQEGPYPELFEHFRTTADVTHQILQRAANARARLRDQDNDKKWVSRTLAPICEHGTLFQCQVTDSKGSILKGKTKLISYWVVGRLDGDRRATFLCYQDTTIPQNHIECAFKLAHSF